VIDEKTIAKLNVRATLGKNHLTWNPVDKMYRHGWYTCP
jgi:hypothetical protein